MPRPRGLLSSTSHVQSVHALNLAVVRSQMATIKGMLATMMPSCQTFLECAAALHFLAPLLSCSPTFSSAPLLPMKALPHCSHCIISAPLLALIEEK